VKLGSLGGFLLLELLLLSLCVLGRCGNSFVEWFWFSFFLLLANSDVVNSMLPHF
jgi:hypothetical protein